MTAKRESGGQSPLDVRDSTCADAGKIGLWTKADVQSHFDELKLAGK